MGINITYSSVSLVINQTFLNAPTLINAVQNIQIRSSGPIIIIHIQYFNIMHKFVKKIKEGKKETKKETIKEKTEEEKKVQNDEEEEEPTTFNVQIPIETDQQIQKKALKAAKVPTKVIGETEIDYEMVNPNAGKKQVRVSWVPQQGGVIKKFDFESEKEHFVAIGEEYTPPVEQKNSNFVPLANSTTSSGSGAPKFTNSSVAPGGNNVAMEKTRQQILEQQMQAKMTGLKAPTLSKEEIQAKRRREEESKNALGTFSTVSKGVPTFTKSTKVVETKTAPLQKTKQQILQEEMLAKQGSQFQPTFISREQRQAKQLERKRKQEEASKLINFGSGDKKVPQFTSGKNLNNEKVLQKTPQQILQQKMQEQIKNKNLQAKTLTKEEIEQKKLRQLQRAEQQKQAEKEQSKATEIIFSNGGSNIPRFTNSSKKSGDQPNFVDLKN